jgi:hypothetical protein
VEEEVPEKESPDSKRKPGEESFWDIKYEEV